MNDDLPHVRVVAALIEREGRFLITQRRSTAVLANLWEFPSGKVETGETDEVALQRELKERCGVDAEVTGAIACRKHRYDEYVVEMVLYRATLAPDQEPRAVRVADIRWVTPQELENFAFPPADQSTTDLLFGIDHKSFSLLPGQVKPAPA